MIIAANGEPGYAFVRFQGGQGQGRGRGGDLRHLLGRVSVDLETGRRGQEQQVGCQARHGFGLCRERRAAVGKSVDRWVDRVERIIPADAVNLGARSGRLRKASDLVGVTGSADALARRVGRLPGAHSTVVASGP